MLCISGHVLSCRLHLELQPFQIFLRGPARILVRSSSRASLHPGDICLRHEEKNNRRHATGLSCRFIGQHGKSTAVCWTNAIVCCPWTTVHAHNQGEDNTNRRDGAGTRNLQGGILFIMKAKLSYVFLPVYPRNSKMSAPASALFPKKCCSPETCPALTEKLRTQPPMLPSSFPNANAPAHWTWLEASPMQYSMYIFCPSHSPKKFFSKHTISPAAPSRPTSSCFLSFLLFD
ncbi:hypothetical protein VTI74DRAFT_9679 [Chaetomium olivicolor]